MWNCEGCSEGIEDNFEVCWVCGTARDGTPDPSFKPDGIGDRRENPVYDPTDEPFAKTVKSKFSCSKCEHTTAEVRLLNVNHITGMQSLFYEKGFVVVTCQRCGFVELYDAKITDGASFVERLFSQ